MVFVHLSFSLDLYGGGKLYQHDSCCVFVPDGLRYQWFHLCLVSLTNHSLPRPSYITSFISLWSSMEPWKALPWHEFRSHGIILQLLVGIDVDVVFLLYTLLMRKSGNEKEWVLSALSSGLCGPATGLLTCMGWWVWPVDSLWQSCRPIQTAWPSLHLPRPLSE